RTPEPPHTRSFEAPGRARACPELAEGASAPTRAPKGRGSEVQGLLYIVVMAKSSSSNKTRPRKRARVISSRTVYNGPVFTVTTDTVDEPGGIRVRRDLIHHSGSVVVLAVD